MRKRFNACILPIIFLVCCPLVFPNFQTQMKLPEEEQVRKTLERFKKGIEQGDIEIGEKITTEEFYPFFKGFYDSLAKIYSQYNASFPMEIGHLKILNDGRAKVELYINPARNLFIFTLKKEGRQWKICHNEGIRFPLYSIPDLPYKEIYEIPVDKRKFMIAETELNFMTRVYFYLKKRLGQEHADNFFLDGPGYKVAMDAWLPFIEGAAQFAFYFVIIESNFYGSKCEVIQSDFDKAEVYCPQLAALEVLKRGHAVPKFRYEEYTNLLRTIMEHRAKHCGLDIEMSFEDTTCRIKITRPEGQENKTY